MFVLIFRDFDPEIHDVYKVAELIYDVDYRTFKHVFKSKEEGVEAIKNRLLLIDFAKDAEADENDLFYVFFDDEDTEEKEIIGMFNGGKGVQHSLFGDIKNQFKTLKFSEALGLSKVSFMDNFVLVDVEDDDFYICELAICSNQRGKGYGFNLQRIWIAKEWFWMRTLEMMVHSGYTVPKDLKYSIENHLAFLVKKEGCEIWS